MHDYARAVHARKAFETRRLEVLADLAKLMDKDRTKTLLIDQVPNERKARATLTRGAIKVTGLLDG